MLVLAGDFLMVIDGKCLECDGHGHHYDYCPHRTRYTNPPDDIPALKALLKYLEEGKMRKASEVWLKEGDKFHDCPEVIALCEEVFGPR